jgi:predicted amino acid dehydrogenase
MLHRLIRFMNRLEWPMRLLGSAFGRFNPFERLVDPYPVYARVRATAPIYYSRPLGAWFMFRHRDIEAVLKDQRFSVNRTEYAPRYINPLLELSPEFQTFVSRSLLMIDPPDHSRLRGLVSRAFTPRRVEALRPRVEPAAVRCDWAWIEPMPGERRFGFLMHPLDYAGIADFDPSLRRLPPLALENVARNMSDMLAPFVHSRGRVMSKTGATAYGEFITLPWTAEQFAKMRKKEALAHVRSALQLARDRGAEMVGLGAFTSIVTLSGLAVANEGVPVTSGNSYTAVASAESTRKALSLMGASACASLTAAIVGATGSIGRAMALLLAEEVGRVILVGNPHSPAEQVRERLMDVARDMIRYAVARRRNGAVLAAGSAAAQAITHLAPESDAELEPWLLDATIADLQRRGRLMFSQNTRRAVRRAHVVVSATSATHSLVGPDDLRPGSIVCDLARPANVSREVADARADVVVIDGGVIATPTESSFAQFGLGAGRVYACMAETMLLTLGGHLKNTSLGADLSPETLRLVKVLAEEHGFGVAELRSFGRPIDEAGWQRCHTARRTMMKMRPTVSWRRAG